MDDFETMNVDVLRKERSLDNIGLTGLSASLQGVFDLFQAKKNETEMR